MTKPPTPDASQQVTDLVPTALTPFEADLIRQVRAASAGGAQAVYPDPAGGVSPLQGAELLRSIAAIPPRGRFIYFAIGPLATAEFLRIAERLEAQP
jgi:hypothetical protein